MPMLLMTFAGYSILVSVALAALYWTRTGTQEFEKEIAALLSGEGSLKDRAEVLKVVAEVRRNALPWYARAISTVGIAALITTSVSTAVQTIRSTVQEREVKEWEARSAEAEKRVAQADDVIAAIAHTLIVKASRVAVLSAEEQEIVRYDLKRLAEKPMLTVRERDELMAASIVVREFSAAVSLMNRQPELFDQAAPPDQVSLAEYYYLTGDQARGRTMADRAVGNRNRLNRDTAVRLIVIRLLLGQFGRADAIREAAAALSVDETRAAVELDSRVQAFIDGATKLRSKS